MEKDGSVYPSTILMRCGCYSRCSTVHFLLCFSQRNEERKQPKGVKIRKQPKELKNKRPVRLQKGISDVTEVKSKESHAIRKKSNGLWTDLK